MGLSYSHGHVPGRRGGGETREWRRGQEEQGKKESKTASPLKIKISSFPAWETQEARNLWKSYRYRSQESTAGCLLQQQVPHTTDVSQQRVAQSPQKPRAASRSCLGLTPEEQGQNWGQALPLLSSQAQPFLIWVNGQPTHCRATSPSRHQRQSAPEPARSSLLSSSTQLQPRWGRQHWEEDFIDFIEDFSPEEICSWSAVGAGAGVPDRDLQTCSAMPQGHCKVSCCPPGLTLQCCPCPRLPTGHPSPAERVGGRKKRKKRMNFSSPA